MLTELLTLRETLRPTIDGLFAEASARGHPVIRPLWWANPDDPIAWEIDAQWSLGDDIIFAPVVAPGVHEVRCYLPAGSWVHPPSGEHFTEGWICHPAPLGSPAWFRRAE
jgi:alpha-glucosidase (family GH31 glycosyl hydrolase)